MNLRQKIFALSRADQRSVAEQMRIHPDTVKNYGEGKNVYASSENAIKTAFNTLVKDGAIKDPGA